MSAENDAKIIIKKVHSIAKREKIVAWNLSSENAQLVINNANKYKTTFGMLSTIVFERELCIHCENNDNI